MALPKRIASNPAEAQSLRGFCLLTRGHGAEKLPLKSLFPSVHFSVTL